jgi:hypothetical protein
MEVLTGRVDVVASRDELLADLSDRLSAMGVPLATIEPLAVLHHQLEHRVDALRAEADGFAGRLDAAVAHAAALDDLNGRLAALSVPMATLESLVPSHHELQGRVDAHHAQAGAALQALTARVEELERAQSVAAFTSWIEQADLTSTPLVSVVMPTYNRSAVLPRAIASVRSQQYRHWELLIVDDGSDDDTRDVIAAIDDDRVRVLRVDHRGVCAARNLALAESAGEVIAYLDDDNTMHPLWLKSVAWTFTLRPDVDVLYGAFVVDDHQRAVREGSGSLPRMFLFPYSRERLLMANLADMSAIAHRAGVPGAHFDESLTQVGDWDLLCSLTTDRDALMVPAVACFYWSDAPNRLSGGPTYDADVAAVRAKHEHPQPAPRS